MNINDIFGIVGYSALFLALVICALTIFWQDLPYCQRTRNIRMRFYFLHPFSQ